MKTIKKVSTTRNDRRFLKHLEKTLIVKQNKNTEKEVKFRIDSRITKSQLDKFLKKLGLTIKQQISQKDVYWDNRKFEIINLKRGLRIRYISNKLKDIEFKSLFKKRNGQYVIEEIKLLKHNKLDNFSLKDILVNRLGICELKNFKNSSLNFEQGEKQGLPYSPEAYLSDIGLSPVITLEKERRIWITPRGEVEISVDTISGLGIFVEVEQTGSFNKVFNYIVRKFERSGFATRDITYSGYLDLLLNKNNKITSKAEFEKKFAENHMWNVKSEELSIYRGLTK